MRPKGEGHIVPPLSVTPSRASAHPAKLLPRLHPILKHPIRTPAHNVGVLPSTVPQRPRELPHHTHEPVAFDVERDVRMNQPPYVPLNKLAPSRHGQEAPHPTYHDASPLLRPCMCSRDLCRER